MLMMKMRTTGGCGHIAVNTKAGKARTQRVGRPEDAAEELSDWEANSRYGHSLVATRNEIQNAIQIAERTLTEVDILASEADIDRSDALTDATDK